MGFGRHIDLRFNPIFDSANVGNDLDGNWCGLL